jgi:hypothetical protein
MKKFFLFLSTVAMLATSSKGQSLYPSDTIANFFHPIPGMPQQYVKNWAKARIDYFLVDSVQELKPMFQRCIKAGMVPYGYSAFWCANQGGGGVPQRDQAIMYGKELGAACVIYLAVNTIQNGERGTNHEIYY